MAISFYVLLRAAGANTRRVVAAIAALPVTRHRKMEGNLLALEPVTCGLYHPCPHSIPLPTERSPEVRLSTPPFAAAEEAADDEPATCSICLSEFEVRGALSPPTSHLFPLASDL